MDFQDIAVTRPLERVALITLDRPQALNAYTTRMCEELVEAVETYARDDDQRVLVLTGRGRAFCAGGDVASQEEVHMAAARQFGHAVVMREGFHALVRAIDRLDKPIIAMVNGVAVAGGLTLALACDLRIAARSARLGDTSGRAGLLPDEGGAWFFPRAMGLEAALRMTWFHEIHDADRARELGLVSEVVPDDALEAHVLDLAATLAAKAPLAVRMSKRMMRRSRDLSLDLALGDAEYAVDIINDTADVHEGVAAFLEKRPPRFTGR